MFGTSEEIENSCQNAPLKLIIFACLSKNFINSNCLVLGSFFHSLNFLLIQLTKLGEISCRCTFPSSLVLPVTWKWICFFSEEKKKGRIVWKSVTWKLVVSTRHKLYVKKINSIFKKNIFSSSLTWTNYFIFEVRNTSF